MVGLRPMFRTPLLAFGLGAVAGGLEVVGLGATLKLALTGADAAALAAAGVGLGGVLGLLIGVPAGLIVELGTRRWTPPQRHAAGMALAGALLGCWFLWPLGLDKIEQGLVPAGVAFGLTPVGVAGVVWFNAGYWFRREDIGERRRLGWWFFGPAIGLLLGAIGAGWMLDRDYGSARALADDPVVVLVTIDGLRADHVGALSADAPAATPALDRVGADGVVFDTVVSAVPLTGPAQAALMTGRHPVRAGVVGREDRLLRGYDTVAEAFRAEGYATAAFLADPALAAGRGFEQGFEVWDDDAGLGVRGLSGVRSVRVAGLLRRWLDAGAAAPARTDAQTVAQVAPWLAAVGPRPAFVQVSLSAPAQAETPDELAAALSVLDAQVGALRDAARAAAGARPLTFAVVGTRGRPLGEHGPAGAGSLYDESVRVPLLIAPHAMRGVKHRRVSLQVRLVDVPATLLALCRLDPMGDSEGADLMGFAQGLRTRHYATLLALPRPPASGGLLLGYRAARAGDDGNIKFLLEPGTGRAQLFDLVVDPAERADLSGDQAEAVAAMRARVLQESGPLLAR